MDDLTYYPASESCFDPDTFDKDVLEIENSSVDDLCHNERGGTENFFKQKHYYGRNMLIDEDSEQSEHNEQSEDSEQSDDMILLRMMTDF